MVYNKRKTHEEFVKEVFNLVGNEYEILDIYKNSNTKLQFKHKKCGNIILISPNNFLNSSTRCFICAGKSRKNKLKKSNETFYNEIINIFGLEYKLLSDYINNKTKIKIKHNCGYEWFVNPKDFLKSKGCPKCNSYYKRTAQEFKTEIELLTKGEYLVLGNYINFRTKVLMRHCLCGWEWKVDPRNFLNGTRCPKCKHKIPYTTISFKKKVFDLVGSEYVVLGEYLNGKKKLLMRHNKCSSEWEVTPESFLGGSRCPNCKHSKGEEKIIQFLLNNSIKTKPQYRFENCRNKYTLPFDFAILDDNTNNVICLIEYDGEFHFEPARFSKDKDKMLKKFKQTQQHDQIKNKYCEDNNIPLLRIPYWEFNNIENILKDVLNKHLFSL